MNHIENLKNQAMKIKDRLTKTPLEQQLSEATSNENYNAPTRLLQEIAEATYGYTSCDLIMKFIWKRLDSDNKEWRRILKTLHLIEYLTKNGAPRCVGEFRDAIFKVRSFSDFFLVEGGQDKGAAGNQILFFLISFFLVRDKTKTLVDLLTNEKQIEEERESAKKIRERIQASGGVTSISSNSNYTGYSGDQYTNDKYKGYGSDSVNKVNSINNTKPTSTSSTNETQGRNIESEYTAKYGLYADGSGIDKYRGNKPEVKEDPKPQTDFKQPFQDPVKRLSKPGESSGWDVPGPKPQQTQNIQIQQQTSAQKPQITSLIDDFEPTPIAQPQQPAKQDNAWGVFQGPAQTQPIQPIQPVQTIQQPIAQPIQQPPKQNLMPIDFTFQTAPQPVQYQQPYNQQFNQQIPSTQQVPQSNYAALQQQFPQQQQVFNQPVQQQQLPNLNSLYQAQPQQPNPYNAFNFQQQQPQQPQFVIPQYNVQAPPQQTNYTQSYSAQKKQDDEFTDFQGPTSQPVKSKEQQLLDMLDLKKEVEQQKKTTYQQQGTLLTSQSDMDNFQIKYPAYGAYR